MLPKNIYSIFEQDSLASYFNNTFYLFSSPLSFANFILKVQLVTVMLLLQRLYIAPPLFAKLLLKI